MHIFCVLFATCAQIVNLNKKYSELETHEKLNRVASANAILNYYKTFFNNCKMLCDGSKLF